MEHIWKWIDNLVCLWQWCFVNTGHTVNEVTIARSTAITCMISYWILNRTREQETFPLLWVIVYAHPPPVSHRSIQNVVTKVTVSITNVIFLLILKYWPLRSNLLVRKKEGWLTGIVFTCLSSAQSCCAVKSGVIRRPPRYT